MKSLYSSCKEKEFIQKNNASKMGTIKLQQYNTNKQKNMEFILFNIIFFILFSSLRSEKKTKLFYHSLASLFEVEQKQFLFLLFQIFHTTIDVNSYIYIWHKKFSQTNSSAIRLNSNFTFYVLINI